MAYKDRAELIRDARAALSEANTAEDVRAIWRMFLATLGHRRLGRLLLEGGARSKASARTTVLESATEQQGGGEIGRALEELASRPYAFTVDEAESYVDPEVGLDELRQGLVADGRFLAIGEEEQGEMRFIAREALQGWFRYLSCRLASAHRARLDEDQFAAALSWLLLPGGRWNSPPRDVVGFGEELGYCCPAWTVGQYVFPIARLLSFMPAASARKAFDMIDSLSKEDTPETSPSEILSRAVGGILSHFDEREASVIRARERLLGSGERPTLQEIGTALCVTRERVRQLEAKAWKKIHHPQRKAVLIGSLLRYVMCRQGSLLSEAEGVEGSLLSFVCKASGVPTATLADEGLTVLAVSSEEAMAAVESLSSCPGADDDAFARCLDSQVELSLPKKDIALVSRRIRTAPEHRARKSQRVAMALRQIGNAAHYSEVTEQYNRMFPEDPSTERQIHAILGRESDGVVWTGMRGKFGLRDWGDERPALTLHQAVALIVEEKYEATGRPVPFTVICAEIGKYRRTVNLNSVRMAVIHNAALRQVDGDLFVPADVDLDEESATELSAEQVDRVLREFEQAARAQGDLDRPAQAVDRGRVRDTSRGE